MRHHSHISTCVTLFFIKSRNLSVQGTSILSILPHLPKIYQTHSQISNSYIFLISLLLIQIYPSPHITPPLSLFKLAPLYIFPPHIKYQLPRSTLPPILSLLNGCVPPVFAASAPHFTVFGYTSNLGYGGSTWLQIPAAPCLCVHPLSLAVFSVGGVLSVSI